MRNWILFCVVCVTAFFLCEYLTQVENKTPTSIIAFTSEYCIPCKKALNILTQYDVANVVQIDIHKYPYKANLWHVDAVPTFILLNGNEVLLRTHDPYDVILYLQGASK
jgi:hypothetical protein